jgi:P27 family predicted phage terminase small subunit
LKCGSPNRRSRRERIGDPITKGRKPTPTQLKLLRGNPGKRKLKEDEPRPEASIPECPSHLGEEARAEWERMSVELFDLGLLTALDRAALACYCMAWGRWVEAERMVKQYGEVLKSKGTGGFYRSPYLDVSNGALAQMKAFLTEFGMTPSSRTRVSGAGKPAADDPFTAFLKKKKSG